MRTASPATRATRSRRRSHPEGVSRRGLEGLIRHLEGAIETLSWHERTEWSDYGADHGYTDLILGYRSFRAAPPASSYLVAGYVAYGLAAAASATRHLGGWYRRLGDGLIERIAPSAVELYQAWAPAEDIVVEVFTLGFWFMDLAVEETLELIGAAALLAAIWQLQRIETGLAPCAPAVSAAAGRSA
jgi:hypothetical protein